VLTLVTLAVVVAVRHFLLVRVQHIRNLVAEMVAVVLVRLEQMPSQIVEVVVVAPHQLVEVHWLINLLLEVQVVRELSFFVTLQQKNITLHLLVVDK
jgi:hypothetical protein